ncbi:MAG: RNA pseudouridine synthase [bacterium]|nr:RNA pseudouridine synthase [bacterium]
MKRFFITAKKDTSLLELLNANLPPRHNAAIVISSGGAWIDNKNRITDPAYLVRAQETVRVHVSDFQGKLYVLEKRHIIFENRDLLVVYKPCNLNVHAVPTSFQYDLAYGVNQYLNQQGIDFEATPITRLDRPVEGLVIFGKNKASERKLFELTKERKIRKWYMVALETKGPPAPPADCPKFRRFRDKIINNGSRTILSDKGKNAHSLFVKSHSLVSADIYSVFIFTGRRHQIRFHASHYMTPVVGDNFYGSKVKLPPDEIALMCRGYNIPFRKSILRIRIPHVYIDAFYDRIPGDK